MYIWILMMKIWNSYWKIRRVIHIIIPDTEEEFLIYGNADEETIEQLDEVKFSKWLEEELNLDVVCGFTIAKHILLCIKLNYEEEALMEILDVLVSNMESLNCQQSKREK